MPKSIVLFLFGLLTSLCGFAQIQVTDTNSHEAFAESLTKSKDLKYQEIVKRYNDYLQDHPDDIAVRISKCKFIGSAFYDDYEGYDTNWEATDACRDALLEAYPTNPDVLIYKLDELYGDEKVALLETAILLHEQDNELWSDKNTASLFEMYAYEYQDLENTKALLYANKAELHDSLLDLSLLKARIQLNLNDPKKAKDILVEKLEVDSPVWQLSQKAELLIELEEFDRAMTLYDRIKTQDSSYIENTSLYTIMIGGNKPELARKYLVADTIGEWTKAASLQRLLEHDMSYGTTETALISYKRMQEVSYYDDFFGIKRLKIFLKDPLGGFSNIGLSHFFFLGLLMIVLMIVPYLWVVPVYAIGRYFNQNYDFTRYWNLKHFWLISIGYMLVQVLMILVFYYQDYMNYLFDVTGSYYLEETDDLTQPNEMIFFSAAMLITTLIFLNKRRLKYVFGSRWSIGKIIGASVLFFIFNIVVLRILGSFIDITDAVTYFEPLSIKEEIGLLITEKGFWVTALIVAVLAPIYEEIIFRGIILNSVSRYMGFIPANIMQATLFGAIHFNLALFPFYFIFGIVTGYVTKRSEGLLAGIGFHMLNNFIVVAVLYYATQVLATFPN